MQPILIVGIIVFAGFIFGQVAAKIKLPKVTGYILAGVFLNPGVIPLIPETFVVHTDLITNISLSVITFSVGGTLFYPSLKKLGKGILLITLFEAEFAFLAVIGGFLAIAPYFLHLPGANWMTVFIPISLLMGCLASPTDPTATLAVVHEFKARGDVTSTIMGVAAFDDALGIINYSLAVGLAGAFALNERLSLYSSVLMPVVLIACAIALGVLFGLLLNGVSRLADGASDGSFIVFILGVLLLAFGTANLLGLDELLTTMSMGCAVVNFNPERDKIFQLLERYTEELIFVLFFTISGMHLKFSVLSHAYVLVLFFVVFRVIGKVSGTVLGAFIARSSAAVKRYTAGGLIPQGGIVIGLALIIRQNATFDAISDVIVSIVIGAVIINELLGPISSNSALRRAGEINA